jgi:holo-[acyl-carrier protein] synthase
VIVGMGLDVVDIARVERLLERHPGRAVTRLFTDREVAYVGDRACPAPHYAARIAAKEAAYKALAGDPAARGIAWREIEVVSGQDGVPTLDLHGRAARRAAQLRVRQCWVSLTHTATTAAAVVILETL